MPEQLEEADKWNYSLSGNSHVSSKFSLGNIMIHVEEWSRSEECVFKDGFLTVSLCDTSLDIQFFVRGVRKQFTIS